MSKIVRLSGSFIRNQLFGKYLLLTNTVTGGVMMLTGDYLQQKIEMYRGKSKEYDVQRAKNMCCLGLVFGPVAHYIYKYMEILLPRADARSVLAKLALDQTTTAPISIFLFFYGINFLEGKDTNAALRELKEKFLTVYLADCLIWIPCQTFNFFYLPARYRVVYINSILIFYDAFLSYIKYKDKDVALENKQL